jgi:ABC-2 type transport system permease protein
VTTFRHTLRKELREVWRHRGSVAVLAAMAAVLAVSAASGLPRHRSTEAWKAEAARTVRTQWLTQGARHPHSAAHYGILAFRPLPATAMLEPGVSAFVGQMLPLETHERAFAVHAPVEDATSATRMGDLSPAMLALTLIPLLVVLAGCAMVSGEREGGSLATLLASGASPHALLAGKTAALVVVCLVLLAVKALVELVVVALAGSPFPVARFGGGQVVHALYALIWVGLTMGVSARTRSARSALAILLAIWMVNSFVTPRISASVGRLAEPEPSAEAFKAAVQRDITFTDDGTPWVNDWSASLIAETLERYGVGRIEDLPVGYAGIMLKGSDAHYEAVFERHFARLHAVHRRQEAWQHVLSVAGPIVAVRSLGQAWSGTDLTHTQHFLDAAERYRRLFVEATNDAIVKGTTGTGWDLRMDRDYWASIPEFRYEPPAPWWAVQQHGISAAVLGGWLMAATLWCANGARHIRGV